MDDRDCSKHQPLGMAVRRWFPDLSAFKPRPRGETDDTPHTHKCVDPACDGEWTHTPNDAWRIGRYKSHECPKCHMIQFDRADSVEHDVPG